MQHDLKVKAIRLLHDVSEAKRKTDRIKALSEKNITRTIVDNKIIYTRYPVMMTLEPISHTKPLPPEKIKDLIDDISNDNSSDGLKR